MATFKNKNYNPKIEVGLPDSTRWSESHLANIKDYIKNESAKHSPEQKLATRLQGIRYKIEEYLENNEIDADGLYSIESILNTYLKTLKLSFKKFATTIDTTDGNLKKYLSGQRKFNTDLAMKFGSFFHTSPDMWIRVYTKNELLLLNKEKTYVNKYKKYDYKKVVNLEKVES